MTTLGFLNWPDLDRVLGATTFLVDTVTAEILEADIFFNSAFPWSVLPRSESATTSSPSRSTGSIICSAWGTRRLGRPSFVRAEAAGSSRPSP
jgi:hypothetical protein